MSEYQRYNDIITKSETLHCIAKTKEIFEKVYKKQNEKTTVYNKSRKTL